MTAVDNEAVVTDDLEPPGRFGQGPDAAGHFPQDFFGNVQVQFLGRLASAAAEGDADLCGGDPLLFEDLQCAVKIVVQFALGAKEINADIHNKFPPGKNRIRDKNSIHERGWKKQDCGLLMLLKIGGPD